MTARRASGLAALAVALLVAVGAAAPPAGAQEDPSGTYEGQKVVNGQPAPYTPPYEVTCTGSTCIVDDTNSQFEVASSGTTTIEIETGASACGPPMPPITVVVTLGGGELTVEQSSPETEIKANGCIQPIFGSTSTFTGTLVAGSGPVDEVVEGDPAPGGPSVGSTTPSAEVGGVGVEPELVAKLSPRQVASVASVEAGDRSLVPASVVTPAEAATGGSRTLVNVALAGLAVLLLVFPSQLFNATWSEHHERVELTMARLVPGRGGRSDAGMAEGPRHRLGAYGATVVAGAVIAGFLDPGFGLDAASLTWVVGALVSIVVGSLVAGWAAVRYRRARGFASETFIKAVPSGLVIAVLCVVISRAIGFRPGYLFGLVGGLAFVAALDRVEAGRAELVATGVALAAAFVGWFATIPVGRWANDGDPSVLVQVADSVTAALFIGGIEGLLLGLVPLALLPGHSVFAWSRLAWAVITFVVAFVFFQVLLRPEAGYLGTSATTSTAVTCGLFVAFGAASVLFWGYFRLRPNPPASTPPIPT